MVPSVQYTGMDRECLRLSTSWTPGKGKCVVSHDVLLCVMRYVLLCVMMCCCLAISLIPSCAPPTYPPLKHLPYTTQTPLPTHSIPGSDERVFCLVAGLTTWGVPHRNLEWVYRSMRPSAPYVCACVAYFVLHVCACGGCSYGVHTCHTCTTHSMCTKHRVLHYIPDSKQPSTYPTKQNTSTHTNWTTWHLRPHPTWHPHPHHLPHTPPPHTTTQATATPLGLSVSTQLGCPQLGWCAHTTQGPCHPTILSGALEETQYIIGCQD